MFVFCLFVRSCSTRFTSQHSYFCDARCPDNTIVDKLRLRGSEINEQIYYLKNPRGLTGTYG